MAGKFKPLTKETAYRKVSRAIEENILSGALEEGALLPTEQALCEQFEVTRSTVREGMRLLEQTGLVARGPAKRLVVRRPKSADVARAASRGLALGGVTFSEVWEALATMYPSAAALAAAKLGKNEIADLGSVHVALEKAPKDDPGATVELAVEFFQEIAKGLDNRVMLAMLQSLNMMIGASLRLVIQQTPNARRRILKAQREIMKAIEARDEKEASYWMAKHIDDLKRGYRVADVSLDQQIMFPV